jgi:hypothetical protein
MAPSTRRGSRATVPAGLPSNAGSRSMARAESSSRSLNVCGAAKSHLFAIIAAHCGRSRGESPVEAMKVGTMSNLLKSDDNQVTKSFNGKYRVFWRGKVVNDREFETIRDALEYLARCDAADRLVEK